MSGKAVSKSRSVWCAVLFALVLCAPPCAAQTQKGTARPAQSGGDAAASEPAACRVAGRTFACPEDFAPVAAVSGEDFVFMRHREYDYAVFVAAPPAPSPAEPSDARRFEDELPADVAGPLFLEGKRSFRWKRMEPPRRLSRSEAGSGAAQGFDGARRVFVEFHRLSLAGRDLYVGHVFGFGDGGDAPEQRRLFELGAEAGSVVSECGVQDTVGALTGEKVDPRGTACALMVRPGQDPRKLPGLKVRPASPRGRAVRPPGR